MYIFVEMWFYIFGHWVRFLIKIYFNINWMPSYVNSNVTDLSSVDPLHIKKQITIRVKVQAKIRKYWMTERYQTPSMNQVLIFFFYQISLGIQEYKTFYTTREIISLIHDFHDLKNQTKWFSFKVFLIVITEQFYIFGNNLICENMSTYYVNWKYR